MIVTLAGCPGRAPGWGWEMLNVVLPSTRAWHNSDNHTPGRSARFAVVPDWGTMYHMAHTNLSKHYGRGHSLVKQ